MKALIQDHTVVAYIDDDIYVVVVMYIWSSECETKRKGKRK